MSEHNPVAAGDALPPSGDGSVLTDTTKEETYRVESLTATPLASSTPKSGPNYSTAPGSWTGRNAACLTVMFPASRLGLEAYSPVAQWELCMKGVNTDIGMTGADGWGVSNTDHLTYANAPDLSAVDIALVDIPNPFVPNVAPGVAASTYQTAFNLKYPGGNDSFGLGDPGYTVSAEGGVAAAAVNPSDTKSTLGGWINEGLLGEWVEKSA